MNMQAPQKQAAEQFASFLVKRLQENQKLGKMQ